MDTGGMQVLGPAQDKLHHHYSANVTAPGVTIHPDHFPRNARIVDCPALVGDVLLFSAYCPHRSVGNTAGVMRWAADIRYNVPEAGDYYPAEGGFLGCSAQPGADVVDDWREYVKRRTEHREAYVAEQQRQAKEEEGWSLEKKAVERRTRRGSGRGWKQASDETFASAERHPLEGQLEWEGRLLAQGAKL